VRLPRRARRLRGTRGVGRGISDDPVSDLAAFTEKHDLPFDLLSDESGDVARAYDSYGEKRMFGKTFDGVFRNTYVVDPSGEIARAYENVSPENHAEGILLDLEDELSSSSSSSS
jgi:peroxiredoxin Q/BCP